VNFFDVVGGERGRKKGSPPAAGSSGRGQTLAEGKKKKSRPVARSGTRKSYKLSIMRGEKGGGIYWWRSSSFYEPGRRRWRRFRRVRRRKVLFTTYSTLRKGREKFQPCGRSSMWGLRHHHLLRLGHAIPNSVGGGKEEKASHHGACRAF